MITSNRNLDLFLELLQISLGTRDTFSCVPTINEWEDLFKESERQAIIGVVVAGLEHLRKDQMPPKDILLEWIGIAEMIRWQNMLVNQRCVEVIKRIEGDGLRCCLLKGQGNTLKYPNHFERSAGDIDLWVEGGKKKIVEYVHRFFPKINVQYHHMNFPVFNDVEVELHYFPSFCYNKIHNKYLQQYFVESADAQFSNFVNFRENDKLCIPTLSFDLVFQLSHMMRHFFTQGVGIRHVIDYYYLLCQDINEEQLNDAIVVIKKCGMFKFFCAIVWILEYVLGLRKYKGILPVDEKKGRMVLHEMLKGGNFGMTYSHNKGTILQRFMKQIIYRCRYVKEFPSEPIWRPVSLAWDFIKKRFFYSVRIVLFLIL